MNFRFVSPLREKRIYASNVVSSLHSKEISDSVGNIKKCSAIARPKITNKNQNSSYDDVQRFMTDLSC